MIVLNAGIHVAVTHTLDQSPSRSYAERPIGDSSLTTSIFFLPTDNPDDTDGDGICDSHDLCPGGDDRLDMDGDGRPDDCDPCPSDAADDSEGDGVCDSDDLCPGQDDTIDADGNGVADCLGPVPVVSTWGIAIAALLLLVGAKIRFGRSLHFDA